MLLWLLLLVGLGMVLGTGGLVLAMGSAERRARRTLYRSLGLAESTVEFLMKRNRDVIAELNYLRRQGEVTLIDVSAPAARRERKLTLRRAGRQTDRLAPGSAIEGERPTPAGDRGPSIPDGETRH
jgi:hypothetical protein